MTDSLSREAHLRQVELDVATLRAAVAKLPVVKLSDEALKARGENSAGVETNAVQPVRPLSARQN
jgi:hypothetical protein